MKLSRVPPSVRALKTDERRLAWGRTSDGSVLVATASFLYVDSERLPWTQVERISWKPPVLTVIEVARVEGTGLRRSYELAEDGRLAEIVRARVTSSVGWSDRRSLHPSGAVRLVGRRTPGMDLLEWQTVWAPGTDPDDPALQAQAAGWVEVLRKTIG